MPYLSTRRYVSYFISISSFLCQPLLLASPPPFSALLFCLHEINSNKLSTETLLFLLQGTIERSTDLENIFSESF